MINLLLLLLFLVCIGITGAWIAENPGHVTMDWFDYRIDTSFAVLLLLAVVASITLAYATIIIRRLILLPHHVSQQHGVRRYQKGLSELTHSVAALAAADIAGAEAHTRKAEKLLGRTPLTLLLSAQIARSQGDDGQTRLLLEHMLEHPETEYLAARSLSESASKQAKLPQALTLAQRAHALNPKGIAAVLGLHIRLAQWQQAMQAVAKAVHKGQITRTELRRYRGMIYLQQGMQLMEEGHREAALIAARQAVKQSPDFVPAIIFAARAYAANQQHKRAVTLLLRAWKKAPQPQLAEALRTVIADEPEKKRSKILRKMAALHPAEDSRTAFRPKPAWICQACGHVAPHWNAHCPHCQAFDTLEWKARDIAVVL